MCRGASGELHARLVTGRAAVFRVNVIDPAAFLSGVAADTVIAAGRSQADVLTAALERADETLR
jgi:hypothetical protein